MIDTYTLSNGLRLIMERMPHLRSTSIGVWVKAGSMLEKQTENGISHLMEHMAFKGTARRDAAIARMGRNDDCICGSGRKLKRCCGRVY